jgi:hypothetical protein
VTGAGPSEVTSSSYSHTGPVIVLTYAHAGAELLTRALAAGRNLACTTATGVLPLCHEAIATWRRVDGGDGPPTALAVKSVRALATAVIATIQARVGGQRWCETAFTSSSIASTFLQVFPGATFLCLHRQLSGVMAEAAETYPWGLGGSPFWPYAASHPGNNAATIATYWTERSQDLLDFEEQHSTSCLRVSYEQIDADHVPVVSSIYHALGLDLRHLDVMAGPSGERSRPALVSEPPDLASTRIPASLLTAIHALQVKLGHDQWPANGYP